MHEHRQPMPWENEIRPPGQIFSIQPEPISEPVRKPPHRHLGRGVARANSRHHAAAVFGIADISHRRDLPFRASPRLMTDPLRQTEGHYHEHCPSTLKTVPTSYKHSARAQGCFFPELSDCGEAKRRV